MRVMSQDKWTNKATSQLSVLLVPLSCSSENHGWDFFKKVKQNTQQFAFDGNLGFHQMIQNNSSSVYLAERLLE